MSGRNRLWRRFGMVLLCLSLNGGCKRVDESNPRPEVDVPKNQFSAEQAKEALVEYLESLDFQKDVMESADGLWFLMALDLAKTLATIKEQPMSYNKLGYPSIGKWGVDIEDRRFSSPGIFGEDYSMQLHGRFELGHDSKWKAKFATFQYVKYKK